VVDPLPVRKVEREAAAEWPASLSDQDVVAHHHHDLTQPVTCHHDQVLVHDSTPYSIHACGPAHVSELLTFYLQTRDNTQ